MVAAVDLATQHIVEMAHVVESRGVVGDGELLNPRHVARIFNRDGRVVGQNMKKSDRVVRQLVGAWVEDFNRALRALSSPQRQRNHRTHL